MNRPCISAALIAAAAAFAPAAEPPRPSTPFPTESIKFVLHRVGNFRSEACNVGDFNKDGKLDIVAGPYIYLAPDFKPIKFRDVKGQVDNQGKGYTWDFANLPLDVDGDGWLDLVSADWFDTHCIWHRNPGGDALATTPWTSKLIEKNGNFEGADLWDINGDGKRNEVLAGVQRTVWYSFEKDAGGNAVSRIHVVSEKKMDFGGGVGDINGDGQPDIVRTAAWFEAPANPADPWKEHPLALGSKTPGKTDHTAQIWIYDVNKDGRNDLVCSSAHNRGIFWYEQVRENGQISFKQHVIDESWTQAHSIELADINNDGDLDLVTGKRFMAHNGSDPEETAPLGVYWYELKRSANPTWTKHIVSYNEGIGAGISLPVADLDGDGDLDLIVTGKWGGPAWFENKAK